MIFYTRWLFSTIYDSRTVLCQINILNYLSQGVEYLFRIKVRNAVGDSICFTMDTPVVPKRDITVPGEFGSYKL